jgi:hypothetical protein
MDDSPPFAEDDYYIFPEDTIVFGNVQDNDYDWDDPWFWTEFNFDCIENDLPDPVYKRHCVPDFFDKRGIYDLPDGTYEAEALPSLSEFHVPEFSFYGSSAGDFVVIPGVNYNWNYGPGLYIPYSNNDLTYWSWWYAYLEVEWVPVNDPPVVSSYPFTVEEDGEIYNASLSSFYYDVDSSPSELQVVVLVPPAAARAWSIESDGSVFYQPIYNFYGYDFFVISVNK